MGKPLISVIMPIYKVESYLEKCLASVLSQTLDNIEIIAVNDGSPDRCGEIVDNFSRLDKRIVVIHKVNGGYGSAINAGLEMASGEYVSIVETDDYIAPNMLEVLYKNACLHNADISRCSYFIVRDNHFIGVEITLGAGLEAFDVSLYPDYLVTPPAIWSAIYKKSLIDDNVLRVIDSPGASYQDVDFFVRTALLAKKIFCSELPLYYYRLDNPNSSTNSISKAESIINNYKFTDSFMLGFPVPLSDKVLKFYKKRKICDYRWHFNRISSKFRRQYALLIREQFQKIDYGDVKGILSKDMRLFYMLILYFPRCYSLYFNFKRRN